MRLPTEAFSQKKTLFLHLCAWAGICGPVLFVLVFTLDGLFLPDYSSLSQMVSWLSLRPTGWIQNSNFFVFGLLLIFFTYGFLQTIGPFIPARWGRICGILLFVSAAGWVNDSFFISDSPNAPLTPHGFMHDAGFIVIFSFLIFSSFLLGRQLLRVSGWRAVGWYSIVTSIATLGSLVLLFRMMNVTPQMTGLFNRILIIVAIAWYVVMGIRLLTYPKEYYLFPSSS